jgi:hypothetical protein
MKKLEIHEYTKVLVPANQYDFNNDKRLLIPFTSGEKIGFVNREGEIIVKPQFSIYYGDCYSENDYIKVGVPYNYGFSRANGNVSAYSKLLYGLINHKGELVVEPEDCGLLVSKNSDNILLTVQNKDREYGVINIYGEEIVPFGKYNWIDGYDKGIARVKIGNASSCLKDNGNKWGLIDEAGNEVLPVEYDEIWNFYGKNRKTTKIVKDGLVKSIVLSSLLSNKKEENEPAYDFDDDYCSHYGDYSGSYAQDVMGYSDDVINDAFDGEPDAYWNID